jgi:hypothetical protein
MKKIKFFLSPLLLDKERKNTTSKSIGSKGWERLLYRKVSRSALTGRATYKVIGTNRYPTRGGIGILEKKIK